MKADLSIVIGTLNRLDQLKRGIQSIRNQTRHSFRIYVTDAGSTDGTIEYLQSLGDPRVIGVLEGRRLGQATAYNRVLRTIDSPFVCWLSDDNVIVNHGLDTAISILQEDAAIGLVGLKVRDIEGPFATAPYIGGITQLGILNVNQGVLRTPEFRAVGFLSEYFQNYGIDPNLTTMILLAGLDVVYTREVAILHSRNWPADTNTPEFQRVMGKQKEAQEKYLRKFDGLLPPDPTVARKKALWERLKKMRPMLSRINDTTMIGGAIPRDWYNLMNSRFISRRELRHPHKLYHLRQHLPPALRRARLPADPV